MTVPIILLLILTVVSTVLLFMVMAQRKYIKRQDQKINGIAKDLVDIVNLKQANFELKYKTKRLEAQNKNLMAMYQDLRNSCIVLPTGTAVFYYIKLDYVDKKNYTASFSRN